MKDICSPKDDDNDRDRKDGDDDRDRGGMSASLKPYSHYTERDCRLFFLFLPHILIAMMIATVTVSEIATVTSTLPHLSQ